MSDVSQSSADRPLPEDLFWVGYLREDIRELHQDVRQQVYEVRQDVRQDLHELRQDVRQNFDDVRQNFDDLRQNTRYLSQRIDGQFRWLMTTVLGVGGLVVASIGVAVSVLRP